MDIYFRPDSRDVLTAGKNGIARIWDTGNGKEKARINLTDPLRPDNQIHSVTWSADGGVCYCADDDGIWGYKLGNLDREEYTRDSAFFHCSAACVTALSLSPDKRYLAYSKGVEGVGPELVVPTGINVRDLTTNAEVVVAKGESMVLARAIVWYPDSKAIAMVISRGGGGNAVCAWDVIKNSEMWHIPHDCLASRSPIAVSPDGNLLAVLAPDGKVELRNPRSGKLLGLVACDKAREIVFLPDRATIAVISDGDGMALWSVDSGKLLRRMKSSKPEPQVLLAVSPDGRLIAGVNCYGTATLWEASTGNELTRRSGHTAPVVAVSVDQRNRRMISAAEDGTIIVWKCEGGDPIGTIAGTGYRVDTISLHPDGRHVVLGGRGAIVAADLAAGEQKVFFSGDRRGNYVARYCDGGNAIITYRVWGSDPIRVIDPRTGAEKLRIDVNDRLGRSLVVSPDGGQFAMDVGQGDVVLCDLDRNNSLRSLGLSPLEYRREWLNFPIISYSQDGQLIALSGQFRDTSLVKVHERVTGKLLRTFDLPRELKRSQFGVPAESVTCVAFLRRGRVLATGSHLGLRFWDVGSGEFLGSIKCPQGIGISTITAVDESRFVVGYSDGLLRLWTDQP